MSVSHASWEFETLIDAVSLLLLHRDGIVFGFRVLLSISLIHGDLTDDLVAKLFEDGIKEQLHVFTGIATLLFDSLGDSDTFIFLCLRELVDFLLFGRLACVDESLLTHLEHELTMLEQVFTEVLLQNEQVLVQRIKSPNLVLLLYSALPQAHEFPLFELLEEGKVFDVVVRVTLDKPLA